MSAKNTSKEHPMGGWFGTIGGIIGLLYGIDLGGTFVAAIIGMVVGAVIGIAVEHIVYRILIFLAALIIYLMRREFFRALLESWANG